MVMEYTTAFRRSRRVQKHGRRSWGLPATVVKGGWS
jgi:hypothetical protein